MSKISIFDLSRDYVRVFIKYITLNIGSVENIKEVYDLLSWSLKNIYDLETNEYNLYIERYGRGCVEELSRLKTAPQNKKDLSIEQRVNILDCSLAYFVAITKMTT